MSRGINSPIEGNLYERKIYDIIRHIKLNHSSFNTQPSTSLGGSLSRNDIECNHTVFDVPIEIKKFNTPDWMQCRIQYNKNRNRWEPVLQGKIPNDCRTIFKTLLERASIFDGDIPPFVKENITYEQWLRIKRSTNKWNDYYIDIPNHIIRDLYRNKGCSYIQISGGFGLYHLGEDECGFKVPEFIPDQQLRIRIKIHSRCNSRGFCSLSVTASCQPKNIKMFGRSPYSLDSKYTLPVNLTYQPSST